MQGEQVRAGQTGQGEAKSPCNFATRPQDWMVSSPGIRAQRWRPHVLRTSNGAELDPALERGQHRRVDEITLSKAPRVSPGFHERVGQLQPEQAELIAPVDQAFEARPAIGLRPPLQASSASRI